MRKTREKGSFIEWLLMLLALSVVIFAIIVPKTGRQGFNFSFPAYAPTPFTNPVPFSGNNSGGIPDVNSGGYPAATGPAITNAGFSGQSSGTISISTGNAAYTIQPMEEYIIIRNNGNQGVNLTGWRLENAKSQRAYAVGDSAVHYASDTAIIPQGARIISPSGANIMGNIVLKPGEEAIVVSGSPENQSPYRMVSFKETECTGYLGETFRFPLGLMQSCVRPSNEPGIQGVDLQCRNYIDSIATCHTPKPDTVDPYGNKVDSRGETCKGCIDGKSGLSSICTNFIKSHYSYAGCLFNHSNDNDFERRTWHVYLYRPWEMWASSNETILLYDNLNRLQAYYSY
ncbi:hypothetical protein KW796_02630 [Candidatus Parcubacteria bacterium]|nr:hypothetical protein [Candidatus Parcubacteria bacterium]